MQSFLDMAEAHAWTLQRLREMAGRLTEQAYLKALDAGARTPEPNAEDAQRWMLVFDKMARGLRLTIALEARLARERRWDADEIRREATGDQPAPRWRAPARAPADAEPRECDRERDDDGLPEDAPLAQRIGRLKTIIEGAAAAAPPPIRYRFEPPESPRPEAPWTIPAAGARADADHPTWRGSG